jgi:hypothetical protein
VENETVFGIGKEIIYINEKKHLQKVSILKNVTVTGIKSFLIQFEANGN